MALNGDTGLGATFTMGTQAITLLITSITVGEEKIDMLDVSTLASTGFMEKVASDLKDAGEATVEFLWKTSTDKPAVGAAAETFTITWPQQAGDTAAATLAGTGVGTSLKYPDLKPGEIQKGSYTFTWDGDTGPTYTEATTA